MLKIRLQRIGRKHEPVFRLVLTDSKNSAKSGKFLEVLGNYDARRGEKAVFNEEKINYWISKGAQVSDTVHNMLVDKKYIDGKKINKLPLKKAIVKDVPPVVEQTTVSEQSSIQSTDSLQETTPVVESAPVETSVAESVEGEVKATEAEEIASETPTTPEEKVA